MCSANQRRVSGDNQEINFKSAHLVPTAMLTYVSHLQSTKFCNRVAVVLRLNCSQMRTAKVPRLESSSIHLHQLCAHCVSRQLSQTFQKKGIIKARAYHQNHMGFICMLLKATVVREERSQANIARTSESSLLSLKRKTIHFLQYVPI